jgi:hypothetical protein
LKKGDWTQEEDMILFGLHNKLGNQWSQISKYLPGRTDNAIKNRFHTVNRSYPSNYRKPVKGKESTSTQEIANVLMGLNQVPLTTGVSSGSSFLADEVSLLKTTESLADLKNEINIQLDDDVKHKFDKEADCFLRNKCVLDIGKKLDNTWIREEMKGPPLEYPLNYQNLMMEQLYLQRLQKQYFGSEIFPNISRFGTYGYNFPTTIPPNPTYSNDLVRNAGSLGYPYSLVESYLTAPPLTGGNRLFNGSLAHTSTFPRPMFTSLGYGLPGLPSLYYGDGHLRRQISPRMYGSLSPRSIHPNLSSSELCDFSELPKRSDENLTSKKKRKQEESDYEDHPKARTNSKSMKKDF